MPSFIEVLNMQLRKLPYSSLDFIRTWPVFVFKFKQISLNLRSGR